MKRKTRAKNTHSSQDDLEMTSKPTKTQVFDIFEKKLPISVSKREDISIQVIPEANGINSNQVGTSKRKIDVTPGSFLDQFIQFSSETKKVKKFSFSDRAKRSKMPDKKLTSQIKPSVNKVPKKSCVKEKTMEISKKSCAKNKTMEIPKNYDFKTVSRPRRSKRIVNYDENSGDELSEVKIDKKSRKIIGQSKKTLDEENAIEEPQVAMMIKLKTSKFDQKPSNKQKSDKIFKKCYNKLDDYSTVDTDEVAVEEEPIIVTGVKLKSSKLDQKISTGNPPKLKKNEKIMEFSKDQLKNVSEIQIYSSIFEEFDFSITGFPNHVNPGILEMPILNDKLIYKNCPDSPIKIKSQSFGCLVDCKGFNSSSGYQNVSKVSSDELGNRGTFSKELENVNSVESTIKKPQNLNYLVDCEMKGCNLSICEAKMCNLEDCERKISNFNDCEAKKHNLLNHQASISPTTKPVELWTEKHKPSSTSQIVGTLGPIEALSSWLLEWKNKGHNGSENSSSSYEMSESGDEISKCVLLTGKTGCGKTSLIYVLAKLHGFKVFEVNCSSSRPGRLITSQLQEATQSHHVEGTSSLHNFFAELKDQMPIEVKNKVPDTKKRSRAVRNVKKAKGRPRKAVQSLETKSEGILGFFKKANEAKTIDILEEPVEIVEKCKKKDLLSFFQPLKVAGNENEFENSAKNPNSKNESFLKDHLKKSKLLENEILSKRTAILESESLKAKEKSSKENHLLDQNHLKIFENSKNGIPLKNSSISENLSHNLKLSSSSLILFDDVHVLLEEDEGFWSSVNSFIRNSKKPVILTASIESLDQVSDCITADYTHLTLNIDHQHLLKYMAELNQQEQLDLNQEDMHLLTQQSNSDIRRLLLELQFWSKSFYNSVSSLTTFCLNPNIREAFFGNILTGNLSNSCKELKLFEEEQISLLYANSKRFLNIPVMCEGIKETAQLEKNSLSTDLISSLDELVVLTDAFSFQDILLVNNLQEIQILTQILACRYTGNKTLTEPSSRRIELKGYDCLNASVTNQIASLSHGISPFLKKSCTLDYLSAIKSINDSEKLRLVSNHLASKRTRRFLHYLDSIGLQISLLSLENYSNALQ